MACFPSQSQTSYSIRVRLPSYNYPSKGPQLKNKIWVHFQKSQVSGGCEVEDVNIVLKNASGIWMTVTFLEPPGVQQAIAKTHHELQIDGFLARLEVYPDEPYRGQSLQGGNITSAHSYLESYLKSFTDIEVENIQQHSAPNQSSVGLHGPNQSVQTSQKFKQAAGIEDSDKDIQDLPEIYKRDDLSEDGGSDGWDGDDGDDDLSPSVDSDIDEEQPSFSSGEDESQNSEVAQPVVARSHRVGGAALSVRRIVKEKPRPRPVKKGCLFLSGIPDGCSSEHVELFIENRSGMDEFKIQYGEVPGTALCTFKEDIPNAEEVIKRMSTKKLQEATVIAEKVHESNCILVEGVSPKLSLEMIELYFDNKKKSGGTGVKEVQQGPTDTQAIVYFEDWKVVGDVLSKRGPHKVAGIELLVEEYHEGLGRLSPLDAPTPHVPKPVTVQVSELIMEFIFGKGQPTKKTLIQKLRDVKAILKWPDAGDKTRAKLEPLLVDGQRQSHWLKWSETTTQALTNFLNRCKSSRIAVLPRFWKDVMDKIDQLGSQSFSIQPDASSHLVTLVGEQQDVYKGHTDIKQIIEELKAKADYEDQQTQKEILLTEEQSHLFFLRDIRDKIEQDFPNLKITVNSLQERIKLAFEGPCKIVQEAELWMRREMDDLNKVELKMGCNKVKFVRNVIDKIHEDLKSQGVRAACSGLDDDKIVIVGATRKDAVEAKSFIHQEIEDDNIPIKNQAELSVLKSQKGRDLFDETNKQNLTVVNINQKEDIIELCGFKTSLEEVKENILSFLKSNVINKEFVEMSKSKMDALLKRHVKLLDDVAEQHKHNHLKIIPESGSRTGLTIEGNQEGLMIARRFVDSLAEGIEEPSPPSSSDLDEQELHLEEKVKVVEQVPMPANPRKKVRHLKASPKKSVPAELVTMPVASQSAPVSLPLQTAPALASSRPHPFQRFALLPPRQAYAPSNNEAFVTREGMQILVCQGDITKQSVHVRAVVNPTDQALKFSGGVSRALATAAGAPLQKYCSIIIRSSNSVLNITECILTPGFKLSCLIIHAAGPGSRGHNFSNQLQDTFLNCLLKAEENEVQSLAIPLIGSGAAGSAKDVCAEALVSALLKFSRQSSTNLRVVHLVNIDSESCVAIKQALQNSGLSATSMP